jgi:hypothetical protein
MPGPLRSDNRRHEGGNQAPDSGLRRHGTPWSAGAGPSPAPASREMMLPNTGEEAQLVARGSGVPSNPSLSQPVVRGPSPISSARRISLGHGSGVTPPEPAPGPGPHGGGLRSDPSSHPERAERSTGRGKRVMPGPRLSVSRGRYSLTLTSPKSPHARTSTSGPSPASTSTR